MKNKNFLKALTKCAALALVFGLVGGSAFYGVNYFMGNQLGTTAEETKEITSTQPIQKTEVLPTTMNTSVDETDISQIVEQTMPSIVAITSMTKQQVIDFFGQGGFRESESSGSGIIISKDEKNLYVATNNHVVDGASALTVQFSDDSTASGTIRGTAPSNDLAVVAVSLEELSEDTLNTIKEIQIGDSDKTQVGECAIAIGNALGYGQSVTTGVISALNREVALQDESTGQKISNKLIQTDAAINPGNSGGALINKNGELIGINSSKYADTSVEGMGFAIPVSVAQPILKDLIEHGKTTTTGTPYLGIYGVDVTEDVAGKYNMPKGVYIAQIVEGSGAEEAGLVAGQIITRIDDQEVSGMEELKSVIEGYKVGDEVELTVKYANNGGYQEEQVKVTLSAQSQ